MIPKSQATRELYRELLSKTDTRNTIHAFVAEVARTTSAHETPLSGYCTPAQQERVVAFLHKHFKLRDEDVDVGWLSGRLFNALARGEAS